MQTLTDSPGPTCDTTCTSNQAGISAAHIYTSYPFRPPICIVPARARGPVSELPNPCKLTKKGIIQWNERLGHEAIFIEMSRRRDGVGVGARPPLVHLDICEFRSDGRVG
eukprot:1342638-Amorphochlora_amoeboformis.AAC.1